MKQLRKELMTKAINNELSTVDLIEMVIDLQGQVNELTISQNQNEIRSSHEAAEASLKNRKRGY